MGQGKSSRVAQGQPSKFASRVGRPTDTRRDAFGSLEFHKASFSLLSAHTKSTHTLSFPPSAPLISHPLVCWPRPAELSPLNTRSHFPFNRRLWTSLTLLSPYPLLLTPIYVTLASLSLTEFSPWHLFPIASCPLKWIIVCHLFMTVSQVRILKASVVFYPNQCTLLYLPFIKLSACWGC